MAAIVDYISDGPELSTNVNMTQTIEQNHKAQLDLLDSRHSVEITQLYADIQAEDIDGASEVIALLYLTEANKEFINEVIKLIVYIRELLYIRVTEILPCPSDEQHKILELSSEYNVICDSVAGSGKTTTICHILRSYNIYMNELVYKNALILTYNKRLQLETRNRLNALEKYVALPNVKNYTYHGFVSSFYHQTVSDDKILQNALDEDWLFPFNFDIIIIDEAQDMKEIYYKLVCKILHNSNNQPKICVLGDKHQSVYTHKQADPRYLTFADQLFRFNDYDYRTSKLSISYRLTQPMAKFVNECVLKQQRIESHRDGLPVDYYICNTFKQARSIANIIVTEMKLHGYLADDIFVLAKTIRQFGHRPSPIRLLMDELSFNYDTRVYKSRDDDEKLLPREIKDKIVFSSFHQVKGLERKMVVIMGFDSYYYNEKNADEDKTVVPNAIYVAVTRAKEKLILIHHYENDYLPFLARENLQNCVNVIYKHSLLEYIPPPITPRQINITELLNTNDNVLDDAAKLINYRVISPPGQVINIVTSINDKNGENFEGVADINGCAIPAYYEYETTNKMTIYKYLKDRRPLGKLEIPRLLKIATEYLCMMDKCYYRLNQIKKYDWLRHSTLLKCTDRLKQYISSRARFEITLKNGALLGVADCIDDNILYEFKCVKEIKITHVLQLAIYAYLSDFKYRYRLMNILDGSLFELDVNPKNIRCMVKHLMNEKNKKPIQLCDDKFMTAAEDIRIKYWL